MCAIRMLLISICEDLTNLNLEDNFSDAKKIVPFNACWSSDKYLYLLFFSQQLIVIVNNP